MFLLYFAGWLQCSHYVQTSTYYVIYVVVMNYVVFHLLHGYIAVCKYFAILLFNIDHRSFLSGKYILNIKNSNQKLKII